MEIQGCLFADDVLFDAEGLSWARPEPLGDVTIGLTSILAALAGRLVAVKAKPAGERVERGRSVGTIESSRYFGAVRTPLSGILLEVNPAVLANPKVLSESPYGQGWFATLQPERWAEERSLLRPASDARDRLAAKIAELHVRCFAAFPDHEMYEIGSECSAVLAHLDELIARIPVGDVIHLVSDDVTAPIEMIRWRIQSGQELAETRKEGNLYHFLVRKAK